ncbi:hypothetical protein [Roseomonas populi]|uniref:DUF2934 domain-containing protein n=1 Tax=Roseomonas populi TaxID=3121582 RepID=A0ABT1X8W8_9PROT|nr:hypothetical protein [Roseomonas pecuniae]MCR0984211.1 hypothetical protein [Roseomonas pecuniae]
MANPPRMTDAQRAYEARRAAKAGLSLEKWLAAKEKDREEERRVAAGAAAARAAAVEPAKKPNLFRRLLDRAQQPLKGS